MSVRRIFVEKRQGFFDIKAQQLCDDLIESFGLTGLKAVRLINRYDIEGLSDKEYAATKSIVFSEPPVDVVYEETLPVFPNSRMFAVEYLPGQYDQRADSASECYALLTAGERIEVKTAKVIILKGNLKEEEVQKIKHYYINPVDSREVDVYSKELLSGLEDPADVEIINGFIQKNDEEIFYPGIAGRLARGQRPTSERFL